MLTDRNLLRVKERRNTLKLVHEQSLTQCCYRKGKPYREMTMIYMRSKLVNDRSMKLLLYHWSVILQTYRFVIILNKRRMAEEEYTRKLKNGLHCIRVF